MQLPLRIDRAADATLQDQVADQLRELILDGRLAPKTRLPSTRVLAVDLSVSRNTITAVYAQLTAEGLLESHEPIGTFVARRIVREGPRPELAVTADPEPAMVAQRRRRLRFRGDCHRVLSPHRHELDYDFWVGSPDARLFPMRQWQALLQQRLRGSERHLCEYGDPQGVLELREQIARHVGATRGIATDASRILITNGIQEGLSLLACLLLEPGVPVALENPCYSGAAHVFCMHGADLRPVPLDEHGLLCEHLPRQAALAYVTPSHQYPLGATLSLQRRRALLQWARDGHRYIAEDDYDSDFYYDGTPLPALKSMDEADLVIYLGTFSKCLGAGLRIGYMVLPAELVEPARRAKALLNNCQPWLGQATLAEFMADGSYAAHTRRLRQVYGERRAHLCAALGHFFPDWGAGCASSGMHAVVRLPADGPDALAVEQAARAHGVGVYAIEHGNAQLLDVPADDPLRRVLLFGYAALQEVEISEAVLRLRRAMGAWVPAPALAGRHGGRAHSRPMRSAAAAAQGARNRPSASMAPSSES